MLKRLKLFRHLFFLRLSFRKLNRLKTNIEEIKKFIKNLLEK